MTSKIGQGASGLCYKARREGGRGGGAEEERRATELSLDVFCLDLASLYLSAVFGYGSGFFAHAP